MGTRILYIFYNFLKINPKLAKETFQSIQKLMTIKEDNIDLQTYLTLCGINEFTNLIQLKEFEKFKDEQTNECLNQMFMKVKDAKNKQELDPAIHGKVSIPTYSEPSPCGNLENYPNCKNYCEWHKRHFKHVSKQLVHAAMRYVHFLKHQFDC